MASCRTPKRFRAISLVEVLVVTAVLALMVALLLPQVNGARLEGRRVRCIANLKALGAHAAGNAVSDPRGVLHPRAVNAPGQWIGLGSWDFGGQEGACGELRSGWPPNADMALGATVRPFNINALSPRFDKDVRLPEYVCPGDTGIVKNPNYEPRYHDAAPFSAAEGKEIFERSVVQATGTSYQGDFLWVAAHDKGLAARRFGPFLRPQSVIPSASETLLFYDARLAQALMSTVAAGADVPLDVPGWHGRSCEFNTVMADGHAQRIRVRKQGDVMPAPGLPATSPFLRGSGWRYDCLPEAPEIER